MKVVPRVDPLLRVANTIEEKGGSVRAPEMRMKDVAADKDKDFDRSHDGSHDASTIHHWIADLQVSCPWFIRFTNARRTMEQGISRRKRPDLHQVGRSTKSLVRMMTESRENWTSLPIVMKVGSCTPKDVDQHMAVLPEIVTSTAEVTIDDI